MAFNLRAAVGFRAVYGAPMKGDVAVIQPIAGIIQHMDMFVLRRYGTWYSDYKQNSMYLAIIGHLRHRLINIQAQL